MGQASPRRIQSSSLWRCVWSTAQEHRCRCESMLRRLHCLILILHFSRWVNLWIGTRGVSLSLKRKRKRRRVTRKKRTKMRRCSHRKPMECKPLRAWRRPQGWRVLCQRLRGDSRHQTSSSCARTLREHRRRSKVARDLCIRWSRRGKRLSVGSWAASAGTMSARLRVAVRSPFSETSAARRCVCSCFSILYETG